MTEEQIAYYRKASEDGSLPDDKNPLFLLSSVPTDLLVKILRHDFDMLALASRELEGRGLNEEGKWVGFKATAEIQQPKRTATSRKRPRGKGL